MQNETDRPASAAGGASLIRGTNQSGMRAHNERLVLSLIRQRGPMAKADIARASGLSAQTVSVIMRSLEADGLLVKGEPVRGRVGQPSVPMRLAENGAYFFGLKVGRRSVELVLTNFLGAVLHRVLHTHSYPTPEATTSFTHQAIADLTSRLNTAQRSRIAGLGIAMPFFLWNWAQALGVTEEKLASWRDVDLRAEIAADYDFPVFLQNDASAACGAEVVFGPSDGPRDFLYFYAGYFIGGGIVLNGGLFTGNAGNAGALGPLPVPDAQGGTRQLIEVASLFVLEGQLRAAGRETASMWESAESWDLDPSLVGCWIDTAARGLSHAILAACSIIDFEEVLIDGWLPENIRARLVEATAGHLGHLNLTGIRPPAIRAGTMGADARALGAASLPLSERFLVDATTMQKASQG